MKKITAAFIAAVMTSSMCISAYAQDISIYLDGSLKNFSGQQPVISDGRTLVPLRGLFSEMGYDIGWDSGTKTITLTKDSTVVKLTINSSNYTVNGTTYSLDAPAQIINSSTMVPLRVIADAAGASVSWDGSTRSIYIDTTGSTSSSSAKTGTETKSIGSAVIQYYLNSGEINSADTYYLVQSNDIRTSNGEIYMPLSEIWAAIADTNSTYDGTTLDMHIKNFTVFGNIDVSLNTKTGALNYKQYMPGYEKYTREKNYSVSIITDNGQVYVKGSDIINIFGWYMSKTPSMHDFLNQEHCDLILPSDYQQYDIDLSKVSQVNGYAVIAISCGD